MDNNRNDMILRSILEEKRTITGFLDAVFGFLKRNTDFYHVKIDGKEPIGFARGVKESIVMDCLHRFDPKWMPKQIEQTHDVPAALDEIEVTTDAPLPINPDTVNIVSKTTNLRADDELKFNKMDYKNGAVFERYCWSQTLSEIEIHIKLPKQVQHSKQIQIHTTLDSMSIQAFAPDKQTLLDGKLFAKYKNNDVVWTIVDGKLHISLDKAQDMWWEKCFDSEPLIDRKSIECERYIDELPEEAQATLHKLRTDQIEADQSAASSLSENSTKSRENLQRLKSAWDAEGSPFKGQPFNPSLVDFT